MSVDGLGAYSQFTLLGRGSYGRVLKARRLADDLICVVKQVPLQGLTELELSQTLNEAQVMRVTNHPHVIAYLDSFLEDGSLNIVMEYADCGDLAQVIQAYGAHLMPEDRIWSYTIQINEGLAYLHGQRILHRDLKPSNILLSRGKERAQIGDLGFGRMLGTGERWAMTGVGTPLYFSPELCEERPYNDKSDVWAFGCLVFEMAARQPPFMAANQVALAEKIVRSQHSELPAEYSLELQYLVSRLLDKNALERPSAAQCLLYPAVAVRRSMFEAKQRVSALELILDQKQAVNTGLQEQVAALTQELVRARDLNREDRDRQQRLDRLYDDKYEQLRSWEATLAAKEERLDRWHAKLSAARDILAEQSRVVPVVSMTPSPNSRATGVASSPGPEEVATSLSPTAQTRASILPQYYPKPPATDQSWFADDNVRPSQTDARAVDLPDPALSDDSDAPQPADLPGQSAGNGTTFRRNSPSPAFPSSSSSSVMPASLPDFAGIVRSESLVPSRQLSFLSLGAAGGAATGPGPVTPTREPRAMHSTRPSMKGASPGLTPWPREPKSPALPPHSGPPPRASPQYFANSNAAAMAAGARRPLAMMVVEAPAPARAREKVAAAGSAQTSGNPPQYSISPAAASASATASAAATVNVTSRKTAICGQPMAALHFQQNQN